MSARAELLKQQCKWAEATGLLPDARGYVPDLNANLYRPLSPIAKQCFNNGSGNELEDMKSRPAKMRALHSSSALVVNVFDYWTACDTRPLMKALGLTDARSPIRFEAQFTTNLEGMPPNLDLAIELISGMTVGVESKFCEWLTPKAMKKEYFKPKYFPRGKFLWKDQGLSGCQELALSIHKGVEKYRCLDAAQLLKHALGLATKCSDQFILYYLYYDWPCSESEQQKEEIDRFADLVGKELRLQILTYQELFQRLSACHAAVDSEYLKYLHTRYFKEAA